MNIKYFLLLVSCFFATTLAIAQTRTLSVCVSNPSDQARTDIGVTVALPEDMKVRSASLSSPDEASPLQSTTLPYQLDDLDDDGRYDELFFLTDLGAREKRTFSVTLSTEKPTETFQPRVYTDMMLTNKKIKESNKQNLYISQLTVENGTNAYNMLHHHGAAFESELVAYRIYFDHRQTVDIYGKYQPGLELRQTQFYPDAEQKAQGFGDDVLWVGNTLGVGTLRGWDGQQPVMLNDVEHRSQRLVATGPLRIIIEVKDRQWRVLPNEEPITMTTRYTLCAGHRDCSVDILFEDVEPEQRFATGLINVKDSREYSNHNGLRACWGTDWPVSAKDSVGHKRETVGLGISIPHEYIVEECPANRDNYPFVVRPIDGRLHYDIVFCSDNEEFGYHSADQWFAYLREWDAQLKQQIAIATEQ
ncbi:MAG: DUF4861 domain-containing protein [Prevotella sp.]|nr:DUF4861 domain-containing protein [Prevotella sp.]